MVRSPRIEICFDRVTGKLSLFGYLTLFKAGDGLGSKGRANGHYPSHAVPIEKWNPSIHCLWGQPAM